MAVSSCSVAIVISMLGKPCGSRVLLSPGTSWSSCITIVGLQQDTDAIEAPFP